jgi:hypothetical protein
MHLSALHFAKSGLALWLVKLMTLKVERSHAPNELQARASPSPTSKTTSLFSLVLST